MVREKCFSLCGYEVARSGIYFWFILFSVFLLVRMRHPRTKDDAILLLSIGLSIDNDEEDANDRAATSWHQLRSGLMGKKR